MKKDFWTVVYSIMGQYAEKPKSVIILFQEVIVNTYLGIILEYTNVLDGCYIPYSK